MKLNMNSFVVFFYNILTIHITFLMPFSSQHITDIKVTLSILKFHWPKITVIIYKSNPQTDAILRMNRFMGSSVHLIKAIKTSWSKPSLQIGYNDHFRIHSPVYQNTFVPATIHKQLHSTAVMSVWN